MVSKVFLKCVFLFLLMNVFTFINAQCVSSISTFPYLESFETTNGGWTASGPNTDWAWGAPTKAIINKAASGNNCWITGGLNKSSYNNQKATLQSPCFDFTALVNPSLNFNVFWETEKGYDGVCLQYSTDNGITWLSLGSINDVSVCSSNNWFNTSFVTSLGINGWSGNTKFGCGSGGGSGKWVMAKHSLKALAGQPKVIFRFFFGSGSVCNEFDGFAFDDFSISDNALIYTPAFSYSCAPNKSVSFNSTDAPCLSTYLWDFGDINSLNNSSKLQNPSHDFSDTGKFIVTLTVTNPNSIPNSITVARNIQIANASIVVLSPIKCYGDSSGSLQVVIKGAVDNFTYLWNNNPSLNTALITKLPTNTYSVNITGLTSCVVANSIQLTQPNQFSLISNIQSPKCIIKGNILITPQGGIPPYQFQWIPNVSLNNEAKGLIDGSYKVIVTDANTCKDSGSFSLVSLPNPISINLGNDTIICPGEFLELNPGSFASYKWKDGSNKAKYEVKKTGTYWVKVKDNNGCEAIDSIHVDVKCDAIYFPTAFSPNNGDAINNTFGPAPLSALSGISQFHLMVYNRFGQVVFESTNPYNKWNGALNGLFTNGVYIWKANYTIANRKTLAQSGTLLLFR